MKILIVFYSRTGTTRRVAEIIAQMLRTDHGEETRIVSVEEIKDTVDRSGVKGYLRSGRDGVRKRLTKLEPAKFDPAEYDLVIVGTPIWGWNLSAPVRTYLTEQKDMIKKTAFFCTMGGSGDTRAFADMQAISGKSPVGTLTLKTSEVVAEAFLEKIKAFTAKLA